MKFHIISMPFNFGTGSFDTRELDEFCSRVEILSFHCSFLHTPPKCYWSIFICYEPIVLKNHGPSKSKPSEQVELPPLQAKCFAALKGWRNEKAYAKGFPPYIIASNSLLVEIVKKAPKTLSGLMELNGFGKKKVASYGQDILSILKKFQTHE